MRQIKNYSLPSSLHINSSFKKLQILSSNKHPRLYDKIKYPVNNTQKVSRFQNLLSRSTMFQTGFKFFRSSNNRKSIQISKKIKQKSNSMSINKKFSTIGVQKEESKKQNQYLRPIILTLKKYSEMLNNKQQNIKNTNQMCNPLKIGSIREESKLIKKQISSRNNLISSIERVLSRSYDKGCLHDINGSRKPLHSKSLLKVRKQELMKNYRKRIRIWRITQNDEEGEISPWENGN